ncbi:MULTISPECIES: hypothetical protein [Clostridium]|uniref:Uncharacterized protein n=1 Tax=Clostridium brassicae TaxID=2999072 RepID=A0ABT4D5V0_9CLOT|nr:MULTISPECIES: hypothetical protein [Clostridium]MCY6957670.1 hypothetical protein [Clostridium brassicae]WMJ80888.1 hypothetical protein RBU49_01160 [Clostridium sp. MB40-C1]
MVPFKKMWEDAFGIISKDEVEDIYIVEKYSTGFVIEEEGITKFITKDDFVDFWCRMLCFKEFSKEDANKQDKFKYVYHVVKKLPYIKENSGVLQLVD